MAATGSRGAIFGGRVENAPDAAETGEQRLGGGLHVTARDGEGEKELDDLVVGET